MVKTLLDSTGSSVELGKEIAKGGEGAIFEVPAMPAVVAKLYHKMGDERRKKLAVMPSLLDASLARVAAWPTRTLHDPTSRLPVGFLMPRFDGHHEVHRLYSPAQHAKYFPGCS